MTDKKENIKEADPKHKRYVSLFTSAIVAALAISFIIMAFKSGGNDKAADKPKEQVIPQANFSPSMKDFNEKVEKEVHRRQRMNSKDETMQPQQGGGVTSGQVQGTETAERSLEDEFKDQERQRALRSRVSRAKWLSSGASSLSANDRLPASPIAKMSSLEKKNQSRIEAEQAELDKVIAQLEEQINDADVGSETPSVSGMVQASDEIEAEPEPSSVVGKPKSEGKPKPGHRLIPTGTVVKAVLDQMTMSDYVGGYRARVSHDVYDVSGNYIMIPKGSIITGKSVRISNVNEPIQARMGMPGVWFVLPNGNRISLKKTSTLDQAGIPAIKDKVNYHLLAQFLGVAAFALISEETSREGSGYSNDSTFEGELGEAYRGQFAPLIEKYLNLVPTITLRPGTPLNIFIEDDIYAKPWRNVYGKIVSQR